MKKFIGLLIVLFILTSSEANHTQSNIRTGTVLGWDNQLYTIISQTNASDVGNKLGEASYHGMVSGLFSVFEFQGSKFENDIIFEGTNGKYYKAIANLSAAVFLTKPSELHSGCSGVRPSSRGLTNPGFDKSAIRD
jgi:hypothetical protein